MTCSLPVKCRYPYSVAMLPLAVSCETDPSSSSSFRYESHIRSLKLDVQYSTYFLATENEGSISKSFNATDSYLHLLVNPTSAHCE